MTKQPKSPKDKSREAYDTVTDTVGFLPNIRLKDNVIQGIIIVVTTGLVALIGLLKKGIAGLLIGFVLGLVGSLLLSGTILMVLGWVRTIKKVSKRK